MISYTITALHPLLQVREAASGTGELCGSTYLNQGFQDYLEANFSKLPGWDDEILADAMERFDLVVSVHCTQKSCLRKLTEDTQIKKQYTGASQKSYSIPVPGLEDNSGRGIRKGRLSVPASDMHAIFEPIMLKIIALVQGQIDDSRRNVRAVLLVGGFGQSNYLKKRIEAAVDGVEVLQPPNAWTAVVRGAVMMGLANSNAAWATVGVISRAARKHYGVKLMVEYDSSKHLESRR